MKSLLRALGIAIGVLLAIGVPHAGAQMVESVEFTTTFPFMVGNTQLPAGSYSIKLDDDNPQILELRGEHAAVLFQAENALSRETPSKSEVVFTQYSEGYVLKNIWIGGTNTGYEAVVMEGERHVTKAGGSKQERRIEARKKGSSTKSQ